MVQKYGIGQAVPRFEDVRLLSGGGRFADDNVLPGMLFGAVLRSPHAHARLLSIDVAAARAMPGVQLVLTAQDFAESGLGTLVHGGATPKNTRGIKAFFPPRWPLARDKVRFVGDAVALVVADRPAQAKDATEAIDVQYDMLPAVVSTADATREGMPPVWDERPGNLAYVHEVGDEAAVDAAIARAAHVVRQRLVISRVTVNSMEGRGCVASHDPFGNVTTVRIGTQSVYGTQAEFARIFKVPETEFRVMTGDTGGSFGMKHAGYPEHLLTVWASRRLGRPVKWAAERSESCMSDTQGRDNVTDAVLALDGDGKFLALKVATTSSLGAYASPVGSGPGINNLGTLSGVYTTAAAFVRVTGVYTNNAPTGPFRGAGRPEAAYVIERMVDLAAAELGIDRIALRRRNMIPPIDKPYKTSLVFTYDSGRFEALMDKALELAELATFEARRAQSRKAGRLRGIGVACSIERAAPPSLEAVQVRVSPSGAVAIHAGTTDQGQGHVTMYVQIVCDRLGVEPSKIRVIEGDTEALAFGQGTGGSRVSAMGASAVLNAIGKVVDKGRKIAANLLEAADSDVEFRDGRFAIAGTDRTLALSEVARAAHNPAQLPKGMEPGLAETGTFVASVSNYPNGCQVCEVEIDPDTGVATILSHVVVDDVGTVINPLGVKGQIHGGVAMGAGQVLMERTVYDAESGQLLTGSFMDYCMPRSDSFPEPTVVSFPVPTPTNPLGTKGVGEAGTVGALPVVMNACMDALAPLGIRHIDMPLTPEVLWRAIRDAKV